MTPTPSAPISPSISPRHALVLRILMSSRAGLATVVPFYAALVFHHPVLMWASIGGWLGSLADPGGPRARRIESIAGFTIGGGLLVSLGIATASTAWLAALVFVVTAFATALIRARSVSYSSPAALLAVTAAISTSVTSDTAPIEAGLWFAVGSCWTVLLSSLVWGGPCSERPQQFSSAGKANSLRFAASIACAALAGFVIGHAVTPAHASWLTVTSVAVIQPSRSATRARAVERVVGTLAGCALVVALTFVTTAPTVLAIAMVACSTAAVFVRPRSYRVFVAFLTPVFLLVADQLHTGWGSIGERVAAVTAGGLIAIIATAIYRSHTEPSPPSAPSASSVPGAGSQRRARGENLAGSRPMVQRPIGHGDALV